MHQLRASLYQRRFLCIVLLKAPVVVVANVADACAKGSLKPNLYIHFFNRTHMECCTIQFLTECINSAIFPLSKNANSALSPPISYNKGLVR